MTTRLLRFAASLCLCATFVSGAAAQDHLGIVEFESSAAPAAQQPFTRGLALLHSFEYGKAAEAFRETQQVDPDFALAYWLEAFTFTHPLWGEDDMAGARAVLSHLGPDASARLARAGDARERAYGAAIEAFFADATAAERARAFADSMRSIVRAYPDDEDALAFAALAPMMVEIMGRVPRDERRALRDEAISAAQRVFDAHPRHPGGTHYLIHATDDPEFAARGLDAARSYAATAPAAEHALHMPSHIFLQLGLWRDVVASNERAWAASVEDVRRRGLSSTLLSWHALQWLQYGYLQEGRPDDARALIETARAALEGVDTRGPEGVDARHAVGWMEFLQATNNGEWTASVCERSRAFALRGEPDNSRDASMRALAAYQAVVSAPLCGFDDNPAADAVRAHLADHPDAPYVGALRVALQHAAAIAALRRGDHAAALEVLEPLGRQPATPPVGPPGSLRTHELLGEALLAAGRAPEAVAAFERSLELTPNRRASVRGLERARAAL
ncbi:MAG TPA: hypothetical protein VF215_13615 [Thermoanaerobaculia bacterium]